MKVQADPFIAAELLFMVIPLVHILDSHQEPGMMEEASLMSTPTLKMY